MLDLLALLVSPVVVCLLLLLFALWLEFQWNLNGVSMEFQWNFNGISMEFQWNFNGISIDKKQWIVNGISMEFQRWENVGLHGNFIGISMEFQWPVFDENSVNLSADNK